MRWVTQQSNDGIQDDLGDWRQRFIETIRLSQNSSHEGDYSKKENQTAVKGFLTENCRLKSTCLSQLLRQFSGKILKWRPTKKRKELLNHYWTMSIKLIGKNSPIGDEKSSEKRIKWQFFFLMKKCLILTGSLRVKMIVYGPVKREETNWRDGKKQQRKFPQKVLVWLTVVWWEGIAPILLFEKVLLDHHRYINEVVHVARRYGNSKFGNNWTFQQDNGARNTDQERQEWCYQHFPSFIDKETWTTNSPNLNPLD